MKSKAPTFDLDELRQKAEACLELQFGENSGPAENRFRQHIMGLLNQLDQSQNKCKEREAELNHLQSKSVLQKREVEIEAEKCRKSKEELEYLTEEIENFDEKNSVLEISISDIKDQMEKLKGETEGFQTIIDKGPDWSDEQKLERSHIVELANGERSRLEELRFKLANIQSQVVKKEEELQEKEEARGKIAVEAQTIQDRIDAAKDTKKSMQAENLLLENRNENQSLHLQDLNDKIESRNQTLEKMKNDTKNLAQKVKDAQSEMDKTVRETKHCDNEIIKLSKELEATHRKCIQLGQENSEKLKQVKLKEKDTQSCTEEITVMKQKMEIMNGKIKEVEKENANIDQEMNLLNVQINKVGGVEIKMLGKETESQNRRIESLQRELQSMERKRDLSGNSSAIARNFIVSNETTLLSLENELSGLGAEAKDAESMIIALKRNLEAERRATVKEVHSFTKANESICKQEATSKKLESALEEVVAAKRNNQDLCETIKEDCNALTKKLAENHNLLEEARKEYALTLKEINSTKLDISNVENSVFMEHFHHHHVDEDRKILKNNIEEVLEHANGVEIKMKEHLLELASLEEKVTKKKQTNYLQVKQYDTLVGQRDMLGTQLMQKNTELEKIQDKIKVQQSQLRHGEAEYTKLIQSIQDKADILKTLLEKKNEILMDQSTLHELRLEKQALENRIDKERIKTTALREEMSRPMNIHRWRIMEHLEPNKFESIKKIQHLQQNLLSATEQIAKEDAQLREVNRKYSEIRGAYDHQPDLEEMNQQIVVFKENLQQKAKDMKEIEVELKVQKQRVKDLKSELENLEVKEKQALDKSH